LLEGRRGEGRTVEAEVGLDAERAGVVDELVGAKLVGLGRQPGELGPDRPVLDGADAVLPVVVADKVWRREWEREARGREVREAGVSRAQTEATSGSSRTYFLPATWSATRGGGL
jgi:hypothetical protein